MNLNDFLTLAKARYSCRSYAATPVDDATLDSILEAARLAPSACNRQPWLFAVVKSDDKRSVIHSAYERDFIKPVPVFVVVCGRHDEAWHRGADNKDHTDVDAAIAAEHICLAAAAAGLGSCWICNFEPTKLAALGLPDDVEPIAIIPIGHPAAGVAVPDKKRKPAVETVKQL